MRISKRTGQPIAICDGCGHAKKRCTCLEDRLALHIRAHQLPEPEREYAFAKPRKYRADFAYPEMNLLIEVEGGIYGRGGHSSPAGITRDVEKGNTAMLLGWRVLRCTSEQVTSGQCVLWIREALGMGEEGAA